jgi:hypothetical protein
VAGSLTMVVMLPVDPVLNPPFMLPPPLPPQLTMTMIASDAMMPANA